MPIVDAVLTAAGKNVEELLLEPGRNGWTPLHRAVAEGREEVVDRILNSAADPEVLCVAIDPRGQTPLHLACREGFSNIANAILRGIDAAGTGLMNILMLRDHEHRTSLCIAVLMNRVEICRAIMHYLGRYDDATDNQLSIAIMRESDDHDRTPFHLAAAKGYTEVVKALLSHPVLRGLSTGSKGTGSQSEKLMGLLNMKDLDGRTPLHWAGAKKFDAISALLLDVAADPIHLLDLKDAKGYTPRDFLQHHGFPLMKYHLWIVKGPGVPGILMRFHHDHYVIDNVHPRSKADDLGLKPDTRFASAEIRGRPEWNPLEYMEHNMFVEMPELAEHESLHLLQKGEFVEEKDIDRGRMVYSLMHTIVNKRRKAQTKLENVHRRLHHYTNHPRWNMTAIGTLGDT